MELLSGMVECSESSSRAIHILSCLGSGESYSPFKSQPSNLQLLRARQGFKERIKTVRVAWTTGAIDDLSIAIICSAAIFEELTAGWAAGIEVLDQSFAMVLPGNLAFSMIIYPYGPASVPNMESDLNFHKPSECLHFLNHVQSCIF